MVASHVNAVVKWFNERQGYGFVLVGQQPSEDAIISRLTLNAAGIGLVDQGDIVECDVERTDKGLRVRKVHRVHYCPHIPILKDCEYLRDGGVRVDGEVKFYVRSRGFGFVSCGGVDVFIGAKTLQRLKRNVPREGQQVRVSVVLGASGPEVQTISYV